MEIHAGAGGLDSKQFVHELFAAYVKYAANLGLKTEILDSRDGQASVKITGDGVWQAFQFETGQHAIQRVSETERNGRRHTSLVSVAVLPMPPEHKLVLLPDSEIEVECMRGSGNGGQALQKTSSTIRMTHTLTRISVRIEGRSQFQNRSEAHRILSARVQQEMEGKTQAEYDQLRKEMVGSGNRGEKVRTYNTIKSFAKDHRTNKKTGKVRDVLEKGRFDLLIE